MWSALLTGITSVLFQLSPIRGRVYTRDQRDVAGGVKGGCAQTYAHA